MALEQHNLFVVKSALNASFITPQSTSQPHQEKLEGSHDDFTMLLITLLLPLAAVAVAAQNLTTSTSIADFSLLTVTLDTSQLLRLPVIPQLAVQILKYPIRNRPDWRPPMGPTTMASSRGRNQ